MEVEKEKLQKEQKVALKRTMDEMLPEAVINTIDIEECNEPLVKIVDYVPNVIIYFKKDRKVEGESTLYVRESVAKQLSKVADDINIFNTPLRLKIYDAYRPFEVQERWYNNICDEIRDANTGITEKEIKLKAFNFIFPPSLDPLRPAAHSTGGAVDLTLVYDNGTELDMGTEIRGFDCPEIVTNVKNITKQQRDNRVTLINAMTNRGFVNFPGEWWHYSIGDREWIAYLDIDKPAIYGGTKAAYEK